VFAWPGVGRAIVDAVMARDVPTTCGLVIMTTILYVLLQLVVDLLYVFVDPRIKSQYAKPGRKKKRLVSERLSPSASLPLEPTAAVSNGSQHAALEKHLNDILPGSGYCDTGTTVSRHIDTFSEQDKITLALADNGKPELENIESPSRLSSTRDMVGPDEDTENKRILSQKNEQVISNNDNSGTVIPACSTASVMKKYVKRSRFGEIFHRIRLNKSATAGLIILSLLFLILLVSLFISFESVTATSSANRFKPPSWEFPFGADNLGRNLFLRTIYGTRYSIIIGFGAVGLATALGVVLGSLAGYYSGLLDDFIMRISDVIASIPGMLLGMVIVTVLGQSLIILIFAVGITAVPVFIRITRASILSIRDNEFVEAARAIGIPNIRIIFTQVLPNGLSPVIVTVTASLGMSIIVAASLSFLGFGVPVPHPEWGALVSAGREYARTAPWLMAFPGVAIMIVVLGFNLLGDGLRDALDPKMKK